MKKQILSIAFLLTLIFTASISKAQSGRLSIGFEAAQPIGDFGDYSNTGFGGSGRYELPMGDKIGLMFTAGYITFGGSDGGPTVGLIPVQAGAKFYFKEQQKGLYVGLEAGVHSISVKDLDSETKFSWAPQAGFHMSRLDLAVRYQLVEEDPKSLTYVGLRIAFAFGGDK